MRVLSVIETLGNGGAERVLVNTLPELQSLGIECEVAILFDRDELADELEAKGVKVHRLDLCCKWNVIEGIFKLMLLLKENDYDIIHAHLFFAYFYTGLVKLFSSNLKTVTTFHNLAYNAFPANTVMKKLRKRLDAFVVNRLIDKKVAVSSAVRDHYSRHLNIPDVDLIFNSFPLEKIESLSDVDSSRVLKQYVDVTSCNAFSITPGRLVKEKGHRYLLEAIEQINKEGMDLCHFIVGAGPLKEEIKKNIEKKKLCNVILIDSLVQKELFELIRACDFVVITSISEGFGMVVGEAMALGRALISTEIDGIKDLLENGKEGLLVPPKDGNALAEAIERLYTDSVFRDSLAENAKVKIRRFDTKIIAKQWKQYYERMLNG